MTKGRAAAPAGDGMHHGRFHFDVAARVEEAPQLPQDFRPPRENFPRARIHDQIEIALAIAHLDVGQAVPFFRQRQQRLGQQREFLHPDRQFVGLGAKQIAAHADQVAHVQQLKQAKGCPPAASRFT